MTTEQALLCEFCLKIFCYKIMHFSYNVYSFLFFYFSAQFIIVRSEQL